MDNYMIDEKEIVFVTTTLYSKWLAFQSKIIRNLFPESSHVIIDGRGNWPNSWFYWIDEVKKLDSKYYIHLDEDFFITSRQEILNCILKMERDNIDLLGCPDGFHHYRGANPVALNTFFMIGKISDLKKINFDFKLTKFQLSSRHNSYTWLNELGIVFKEEYKKDFYYKFEKQGDCNFEVEQEPYYIFMWQMKEIGCKFDYLFPFFDDRFKSTNPRIDQTSEDIGIHMWYLRQWNSDMDVFGMKNIDRYKKIEEIIL